MNDLYNTIYSMVKVPWDLGTLEPVSRQFLGTADQGIKAFRPFKWVSKTENRNINNILCVLSSQDSHFILY